MYACYVCFFVTLIPLLTIMDPQQELSINKYLPCSKVPEPLSSWMCMKHIPQLCCIQDIVHIGVKLKAQMLKPSIVLPLGTFLVTKAHFSMVVNLYGKDRHGLRGRDLDHQDRQNFDAVTHIINALHLLDDFPDAVGTRCYVDVMRSAIDSYLDKILTPAERLEEIWYATFFLQYWRQWVLDHPKFSLEKNFITSNAYMCVEINAHSLLAFFFILRDELKVSSEFFLP